MKNLRKNQGLDCKHEGKKFQKREREFLLFWMRSESKTKKKSKTERKLRNSVLKNMEEIQHKLKKKLFQHKHFKLIFRG